MPLPALSDIRDPAAVARGIGAVRLVIGLALLAAPRALGNRAVELRPVAEEAVVALRMAGGRDLALGLGALLAARRGNERLRGWAEAAALADLLDGVALVQGRGVTPLVRAAGAVSAVTAGVVGMAAARRLA